LEVVVYIGSNRLAKCSSTALGYLRGAWSLGALGIHYGKY
jgi:hypothetical protein